MVYVFLLKPLKQWNFEETQFTLLGKYFHKNYRFLMEAFQVKNSLRFCFASFPSLKALTGCLEKLEISAKRFGQ